MKRTISKLLTIGAIYICLATAAKANLTAIITPGYTFAPGENPTTDHLNLLGQPTIDIFGTIGGTNTISPASINGVQMVDAFPDGGILNLPLGATMGWNTASPRQLAVNTAGIVDGYSDIISHDTNALAILADTAFFLSSTNSLGSTNLSSLNTGSTLLQWLTLKAHSIYDGNIATGGISSQSITNTGLQPYSLMTQQAFTNIFTISGGTYTNAFTNFNTVIVGAGNGLGQIANMGPGFTITNIPTKEIFTTNTGSYTNTVNIPTLSFAGFNGSLPLEGNLSPWAASQLLPSVGTQFATSAIVNAFGFGGTTPYTNIWGATVVAHTGGTTAANSFYVTNAAGSGTNSSQVIIIGSINIDGGGGSITFGISNTLYDTTLQRSVSPVALYTFHNP